MIDSSIKSIFFCESPIAKPIPSAPSRIAVLIPTIFLLRFTSGHPEFHGLIAVSVCMSQASVPFSAFILLQRPLITQSETEF